MHSVVYLARLDEPLVKYEKNIGCFACLFAELSVVIHRANNYARRVFDSQILPRLHHCIISYQKFIVHPLLRELDHRCITKVSQMLKQREKKQKSTNVKLD